MSTYHRRATATTPSSRLLVGALWAFSLACSSGSEPTSVGGVIVDTVAPVDTNGGGGGEVIGAPDTAAPDTSDATTSDAGEPCPGCAFSSCESNADCNDGYCIEGPSGLECGQPCVLDCPKGYKCRGVGGGSGDPVFLCVYDHLEYCLPCDTDSDCAHPLLPGSTTSCVSRGAALGGFCATACEGDEDCPTSSSCVLASEAGASNQGGSCQPTSGECGCSSYAQSVSASTGCTVTSELGACSGRRTCSEAGLSSCDARTPAAESCNGQDDDCDGETDEGVPTTGEPCDGDDPDLCASGTWQCSSAGLLCDDDAASATETCNGQDDDCDGKTDAADDELSPVPCELTVGACTGALAPVETCSGGGWQSCPDAVYLALGFGYEPGQEQTCDGKDNDCDGLFDEDVPLTGEACDGPDVDDCTDGAWACTKTGLLCDDGPESGAEKCDGQDNDCDGLTDADDPDLALVPCQNVIGACSGALRPPSACQDGEWTDCGDDVYAALASAYEPVAELSCDGQDNDCDGKTDDDFVLALPDGASVTGVGAACGAGLCAGGVTTCGTATSISCTTLGNLQPESCNGLDDDCDGAIDAADESLTSPLCERQAGLCTGTLKPRDLCVSGKFGACTDDIYLTQAPAYSAGAEQRCDGSDDDCDGQTDEDFVLKTLASGFVVGIGQTCGTGKCGGGVTVCSPEGNASACPTEANAVEEICNGKDDDCDGLVDALDPSMVLVVCELQAGSCAGSLKTAALCKDGAWTACTVGIYADHSEAWESGQEVSCDGVDNDCDGNIDEDFQVILLSGQIVEGAGQPCGAGACTDGVTVCDTAGLGLTCSSETSAIPETCNGQDDDCDGSTDAVDAQLQLTLCEDQDGFCAGARHLSADCVAGEFAACSSAIYAAHSPLFQLGAETTCDGKDNDCDSQTDEDFSLTLPNGATVTGVGAACGVGICAGGVTQCGGGGLVCSTGGQAATEVCNGKDDDCDGLTDAADPSLVTTACEKQIGVCAGAERPAARCVGGVELACTAGDYLAHAATYQDGVETGCDAKDNDCDGSADEDFSVALPNGVTVTGAGKVCGTGVCSGGITVCAGSTIVCSTSASASAETCNGKDDDCDGETDATDSSMQLVSCEKQAGVCAGIQKPASLCSGGLWSPCSTSTYKLANAAYQAPIETGCDGLDNDCDGPADEDFTFVGLDGNLATGVNADCGTGRCSGGKTTCAPDQLGLKCSTNVAATAEICNDQDDDCDGKTDAADPSMATVACELQTGVCGALQKPKNLCVLGTWQACDASEYGAGWQAVGEIACDSKDNDCDGQTDEDFSVTTADGANVTGTAKACGTGVCAGGTTLCNSGGNGIVCSSAGSAVTEVCDAKDNDCDGKTDTADSSIVVPLCEKQSGLCAGAKKPLTLCQSGSWAACATAVYKAWASAYSATTEVACDGADEDCSGTADEDFTYAQPSGTVNGVGASCGAGQCAGGVTICNLAKTGLVCTTDAGAGSEICDSQDNDCDGQVDAADSSLALIACPLTQGVCTGSMRTAALCQSGGWQSCTGAQYGASYQSGTEASCDAKDNDCDGLTDDDFTAALLNGTTVKGAGKSCGVGICSGGVTVCNGASGIKCSSEANATAETCDGFDNDCDGLTDADDPSLVLVACEKTLSLCAGATKSAALCTGGTWKPCPAAAYPVGYQAGAEISCDAKDNDCDGQTDEDFSYVGPNSATVNGAGKACGVGVCAGGTTACNNTQTGIVCSTSANAVAEICDAKDNDCDGATDALDASLTLISCDKTAGVCSGTTRPAARCVTGAWTNCQAADYPSPFEATESLCDQKDNDCNGQTDVFVNRPLNSEQRGACAGTQKACTINGFADEYGSVALYGQYEEPSAAFADENCDGIDGTVMAAIFVSPTGVDGATCGAQKSPCKTLPGALTVSGTSGKKDIYLASGSYAGPLIPTTGTRFYGGYGANWVRSGSVGNASSITGGVLTSVFPGDAMTVVIRTATGVKLHDLSLQGTNATANSGRSSYVVHVSNAAGVDIARCTFVQGNGAAGTAGLSGTNFSNLNNAPTGGTGGAASEFSVPCNDSSRGAGGSGASNASCSTNGSGGGGGAGGTMDTKCIFPPSYSHTPGLTGATGTGGATGGVGGVGCAVGNGGNSGAVSNGVGGTGGGATGSVSSELWVSAVGSSGAVGSHGNPGGGGGGSGGCDTGIDSYGAGGGGGGAGGCSATGGGAGGQGGGSSFGVFVVTNATATVTSSTFNRGAAGTGGAGGIAGRGQPGGSGGDGGAGTGSGDSRAGGAGGAGGHGGHSGGGGGGGGGYSAAIFYFGATMNASGNTVTGGSGGSGGTGGPRPTGQADGNAGNEGVGGSAVNTKTCANGAADC